MMSYMVAIAFLNIIKNSANTSVLKAYLACKSALEGRNLIVC